MRRINHKTIKVGIVLALGLLGLSGGVQADPVLDCQVAKLKAAAVRATCLAQQEAKKLKGKPFNFGTCETNFDAAIAVADATVAAQGATCRYIENGNGTVSDLNTLLIWEMKNAANGTEDLSNPHDVDNRYFWSQLFNVAIPDGGAFTDFLGKLNKCTTDDRGVTVFTTFAGHCDWRLPTIPEYRSIVDCTFSPCIDPIFGPTAAPGPGTESYYWTSLTFATGQGAWAITFFNPLPDESRRVDGGSPAVGLLVRGVRGGR